jgi:peptide/nickel transport system substrate-binding protein
MRRTQFSLLTLLLVGALLIGACAQPAPIAPEDAPAVAGEAAADTGEAATAATGEVVRGGVWTEATLSDASTLNPILGADSSSSDIYGLLTPALIGIDPFSGAVTPDRSMSESWDVSEDGLVWTFNLRDGVFWSDGEQVTADDFKYTYDAIASDLVETVRKSNLEGIESIEVLDPLTVQVTFGRVQCDGLLNLGLGWLPSHLYAEDFSDVMDSPYNLEPAVSAGPFVFQSWARDDNTILIRNESYWLGAPNMDGKIFRIVPDPGARLAQLQSGEVDVTGVQPEQIAVVDGDPSLKRFNFRDDGYTYVGLNLANPENPQPGQDEDGNLIEQDPHPILSEHAVRLAMAHALDYQSIIDNVYLGQGYPIASNVLPAVEWAFDPSIEPYAYDPELSAQILDEAGWVDEDGDGVRERDGQTLSLNLVTNAGNTTREDMGVLVQDQLNALGFDITFEAIDFGTLVEQLLGQTYDMVIIGWTGLGTDPNDEGFWHTENDVPGSSFNFVSFQNERVNQLLKEGVSIPGCAPEDRAPYYQEIQQIIHEEIPYLFVTGGVGNTGYSADWQGIDPGEWSFEWNIETWSDASLAP